ncbi:MAG: class I SAM-dependent methyltransferase [Vicinamibacterales bacterium]
MTPRERATAELYADLHRHASDTYALDYLLPALTAHLRQLGLDPQTALRGKSFLDAGCGGFAGGAASALAMGAGPVVGIDLSEDNVRAARERLGEVAGTSFQVQNLLDIRLEPETFDFVYSVGVLMITEAPERAFRQLVRLVKPGGRIYIGVYGRGGLYNEVAVPLLRAAGRVVPRRWVARALALAPFLLRPSSSLMDVMYVPIEIHYRIHEVAAWFHRCGLQPVFLRHPLQPPTMKNRLLFGDGTMIFFSAVKPAPAAK